MVCSKDGSKAFNNMKHGGFVFAHCNVGCLVARWNLSLGTTQSLVSYAVTPIETYCIYRSSICTGKHKQSLYWRPRFEDPRFEVVSTTTVLTYICLIILATGRSKLRKQYGMREDVVQLVTCSKTLLHGCSYAMVHCPDPSSS